MPKKPFPTFAWIVLVAATIWLLTELGIMRVNVPWLPLIVFIAALGWVINKTQW